MQYIYFSVIFSMVDFFQIFFISRSTERQKDMLFTIMVLMSPISFCSRAYRDVTHCRMNRETIVPDTSVIGYTHLFDIASNKAWSASWNEFTLLAWLSHCPSFRVLASDHWSYPTLQLQLQLEQKINIKFLLLFLVVASGNRHKTHDGQTFVG